MKGVINEIKSYRQYEITPAEGNPFVGWASEKQAEFMLSNSKWTSADFTGIDIFPSIKNSELGIFTPDWNSLKGVSQRLKGKDTLVDNVVATAVRMDISVCSPPPPFQYNYETNHVQELGVVRCCN